MLALRKVLSHLNILKFYQPMPSDLHFLCRLRSIAANRDHFVRYLFVHQSMCLSSSHTFLEVMHSYFSQATHAFLGMLPLFLTFSSFL